MIPRAVVLTVVLLSSVAGAVSLPGLAASPSSVDATALSTVDGVSTVDVAKNRTQPKVLTLTESTPQRTNFTQPGANLSAALEIRDTRLSRQLSTGRTEQALAALETDAERQAYVRRALTEVEIRTSELQQEQRAAFSRHSTGQLSSAGLAIQLARIDTAAEQLSANASRLGEATESIDGFSVQTRIDAIQLELQTLQGPMREHTGDAVRGAVDPTRIYISTTADGVSFSTITGDTYVREVYDGSQRIPPSNSQLTPSESDALIKQSYPAYRVYQQVSVRESDIWLSTMPSRRTNLTAFLDKDSPGRVFKEDRTTFLNRTPPTVPTNTTRARLRLTVYPSYPGGPMLVTVENSLTGEPVRADVSLITPPQSNTEPVKVGTTNSTGALWTVSPKKNFTVQANKIGTQSFVDIRIAPIEPNRVGSSNNATGDGSRSAARSFASLPMLAPDDSVVASTRIAELG